MPQRNPWTPELYDIHAQWVVGLRDPESPNGKMVAEFDRPDFHLDTFRFLKVTDIHKPIPHNRMPWQVELTEYEAHHLRGWAENQEFTGDIEMCAGIAGFLAGFRYHRRLVEGDYLPSSLGWVVPDA